MGIRHNQRLVVFAKKRARTTRYKVYLMWETTQRRERRLAHPDQPYHGFATPEEAFAFADRAAPLFIGESNGTKPPANERPVRRPRVTA